MESEFQERMKLSNIPIINLRWEFDEYRCLFRDQSFLAQFQRPILKPIRTHRMLWAGMPNDFLTLVLQRLFLGLEAYLPYCVWYICGSQGRLRDLTVKQAIENVFSLGRKLPDNLYNKLPVLVDPTCALKSSDPKLYSKTEGIYKDVRNPIFHGKQLVQVAPDKDYLSLLDHFDSLYKWIDSWGPNPYEGWTRPE